MAERIDGKRVAIVATNGFEQSELLEPKRALEQAGAVTTVVSLESGEIKGWNEKNWGESIPVDKTLDECSPEDFDALVLPGGVMNPDKLRVDERAVRFARGFFEQGKPVGAICHGPWLLVEADVVQNRRMTSWPSLKTDLRNAGANWEDSECIVDEGLVTSRKPADLPAFCSKLIEEIGEGKHAHQSVNRASMR
jgi:protease I